MEIEDAEQAKYLEDCTKVVREQSFYMKRAMDGDSLKLALDHATEMLRELRTNLLSPKNYYSLYMRILDELRELEEYFLSMLKNGHRIVEIYEQVQCCSNIVPRLYLLCCVGGVYISSQEAPAKDVLKDLIEMIKGVQHPVRGLFLRNYLTLVSKNKLPDSGSVFEGSGGTVVDAYTFLLQNFVETNRLWVRLQSQGAAKDKKKREKERLELRILVGVNLVRMSQLEGLGLQEYKTEVLPKVLEEVLSCKDTIAQSYLMDCIIQVFPDEFHLATLETFLKTCTQLKEKVNVRAILEALTDRLASHSSATAANSNAPAEFTNSFRLLNECVTTLIEERTNMSLTETLKLQTVLLNFALKCHAGKMTYVEHCLSTSSLLIDKTDFVAAGGSGDVYAETAAQIEVLLSVPLASLALRVLDIAAYATLMSYLPWDSWKEVAINLVKSIVSNPSKSQLSKIQHVEQLIAVMKPLLQDRDDKSIASEVSAAVAHAKFREEQYLVARVPHLVFSNDTDVTLQILSLLRGAFASGGASRLQYTFPSLVFATLKLARQEQGEQQFNTSAVFEFVLEMIAQLAESHPQKAMMLYLQAAQARDEYGSHGITYEFVKDALLIYECRVVDSRVQIQLLTSIVGTLLCCKHFSKEDYEVLINKVKTYGSMLLDKPDQSRMMSLCSHLYWPPRSVLPPAAHTGEETENAEKSATTSAIERYSDCTKMLECMQSSLRIAQDCNANLFVNILDRYLYYFENDNPVIQVRYISKLVALINEQKVGNIGRIASA
eukprot:gene30798-40097_t